MLCFTIVDEKFVFNIVFSLVNGCILFGIGNLFLV